MKQFVIDASQFENLDGFFTHADEVLCVGYRVAQSATSDSVKVSFNRLAEQELIAAARHLAKIANLGLLFSMSTRRGKIR
jgi:hypothetical protein